MRLLVLGGTWFVGRVVVTDALQRGWDVTTFNRGRSGAPAEGVTTVHGDRENQNDLARLAAAGPWDAVVDVAGSVPTVVRDAARALQGVVDRYVFVSTVSSYRHWPRAAVSEDSEVHSGDPDFDPGFRHWDAAAYGPLKAGCEAAIAREFDSSRILTVRPGVVIGPHEYVGRIRWWLDRCARGGPMLAPGRPDRGIQPIDVRDLSRFLLDRLDVGGAGVYNVAAPQGRDTYGDLLRACAAAVGTQPEAVWIDEEWLVGQGVRQWTELPLWRIPPGTWAMDTGRAAAAGLISRPLSQTVSDTRSWLGDGGQPVEHERDTEHGIAPDKEQRLLAEARAADAVLSVERLTADR